MPKKARQAAEAENEGVSDLEGEMEEFVPLATSVEEEEKMEAEKERILEEAKKVKFDDAADAELIQGAFKFLREHNLPAD
jgi:aspartate-semialdehyde dehydrogenase